MAVLSSPDKAGTDEGVDEDFIAPLNRRGFSSSNVGFATVSAASSSAALVPISCTIHPPCPCSCAWRASAEHKSRDGAKSRCERSSAYSIPVERGQPALEGAEFNAGYTRA